MTTHTPEMQVSIKLSPQFEYDEKTGQTVAWFEEFPQAIASGENKNEATSNLLSIFKVMIQENSKDIKEQIVEKYMGGINIKTDSNSNIHYA